jgi:cytoskeletal protein CcmA (bactofilin family)
MFAKGEKLESFIGQNTYFKGEINSKGTLRIDGNVEGNILAEWLIVGDKAYIKGNATATSVIIGGTVEGNILAKGLVDVKKKGCVKGDIITSKLTVADGGMVDGRISMHNEGAKMLEMSEEPAVKETETAEFSQS